MHRHKTAAVRDVALQVFPLPGRDLAMVRNWPSKTELLVLQAPLSLRQGAEKGRESVDGTSVNGELNA